MSSGQFKDGYAGVVIENKDRSTHYTILRRRMEISEGKFFYEGTTVPIKASELKTARATHTMKIILFTGDKAQQREINAVAEFRTNKYIHEAGKSSLNTAQNYLCGEVASCAVDYLTVRLNGVLAGIIVYKVLYGQDLFDFKRNVIVKIEDNPLTKRAARFAYVEFVIRMAIDICRIFHTLHSYGILHGDIKPENLFVSFSESENDRPIPNSFKIFAIDFGLTCAIKPLVSLVNIPETTQCRKDESGNMRYGGTVGFLDPNATAQSAEKQSEMGRMRVSEEEAFWFFQSFETYSVGKTIADFLDDTQFSHEDDVSILRVLERAVEEMTGTLAKRNTLALYGSQFEQLLEYAQAVHSEILGAAPITVIDQGYETPADDSSSESSGRRRSTRRLTMKRRPKQTVDDDNQ